jgi:hypothetical protein
MVGYVVAVVFLGDKEEEHTKACLGVLAIYTLRGNVQNGTDRTMLCTNRNESACQSGSI